MTPLIWVWIASMAFADPPTYFGFQLGKPLSESQKTTHNCTPGTWGSQLECETAPEPFDGGDEYLIEPLEGPVESVGVVLEMASSGDIVALFAQWRQVYDKKYGSPVHFGGDSDSPKIQWQGPELMVEMRLFDRESYNGHETVGKKGLVLTFIHLPDQWPPKGGLPNVDPKALDRSAPFGFKLGEPISSFKGCKSDQEPGILICKSAPHPIGGFEDYVLVANAEGNLDFVAGIGTTFKPDRTSKNALTHFAWLEGILRKAYGNPTEESNLVEKGYSSDADEVPEAIAAGERAIATTWGQYAKIQVLPDGPSGDYVRLTLDSDAP